MLVLIFRARELFENKRTEFELLKNKLKGQTKHQKKEDDRNKLEDLKKALSVLEYNFKTMEYIKEAKIPDW